MMKAKIKKNLPQKLDPILAKVFLEASRDHQELEDVFSLMGWGNLPASLKIEIRDDMRGFLNELNGTYSSCDPYIRKRRQSIDYWIRTYQSGGCELQMAVQALRVRAF